MKRKRSRQALRTRRLLEEAIVALIQERDYSTLRVEDITERADVGRATFYIHYKNKDELIHAVINKYFDEFKTLVDHNEPPQLLGLQKTLEHAQQNPSLYKVMLNHEPATERMRNLLVSEVKSRIESINGFQQSQLDITPHFVAGALLGILRWWLDHMDVKSIEEVSNYAQITLVRGISANINM